MRAKWIDIPVWGQQPTVKSLHHLVIDNAVAAVLLLWKAGTVKEWRLYVPELFTGDWQDTPNIPASNGRCLTVKAPNAETAKLRATNTLVLRWQEQALAGIRLLNRLEEGG